MADRRQTRTEVVLLASWARWIAALLGLALGVLAVAGCFSTGYEWNGSGTLVGARCTNCGWQPKHTAAAAPGAAGSGTSYGTGVRAAR